MKSLRFLPMIITGVLFAATNSGKALDSITISPSPAYGNEIYYSLSDGIVKTVPGSQRDIAFRETGCHRSGLYCKLGFTGFYDLSGRKGYPIIEFQRI